MGYNAMEYDSGMKNLDKMISSVTASLKLPTEYDTVGPGLNEALAEQNKDKFGSKREMAGIIMEFTKLCIQSRTLLRKLHSHNFDLRGKVADLSTGSLKNVEEKVVFGQTCLSESIENVEEKVSKVVECLSVVPDLRTDINNVKEKIAAPTFSEVLALGSATSLVTPVKKALKELDRQKEKSTSIILAGLEVCTYYKAEAERDETEAELSALSEEVKETRVKDLARDVIKHVLGKSGSDPMEIKDTCFEFLGKIKENKAPLVRVDMGCGRLVQKLIRYAPSLKATSDKDLSKVYVRKDMTFEERSRGRELLKTLREKIREFPDQYWVVRDDKVTSVGKRRVGSGSSGRD